LKSVWVGFVEVMSGQNLLNIKPDMKVVWIKSDLLAGRLKEKVADQVRSAKHMQISFNCKLGYNESSQVGVQRIPSEDEGSLLASTKGSRRRREI